MEILTSMRGRAPVEGGDLYQPESFFKGNTPVEKCEFAHGKFKKKSHRAAHFKNK